MNDFLPASVVRQHLVTLRKKASLTALQAARLDAIVETLRDDGRFVLKDALEAGEFPVGDAQGQEAFQDFRKRVNAVARAANIELSLEVDSRKVSPAQRLGWFQGSDLVDERIAKLASETAGRTTVAHPIGQHVAEIGDSRRTRVYVSYDPTADQTRRRKIGSLIDALREALAADADRRWELAHTGTPAVGEDVESQRDRLCQEADLRVALISTGYLDRASTERSRVLASGLAVLPFALTALPRGPIDLGPLADFDVRRQDAPWERLSSGTQKQQFVADLVDELRRALAQPRPASLSPGAVKPDAAFVRWSELRATSRLVGDSIRLVESRLAETSLSESQLDASRAAQNSPQLSALPRLLDWAGDQSRDAPRLCALLGDVGMGKTTTVKMFTTHLLERREQQPELPLPILFDLRDVGIDAVRQELTLDRILASMLTANRPLDIPAELLDAEVVRRRIAVGGCVVIFDGLDEALVHLSPHEQQLFTRQLWRAVDERCGSKLLLTCRTQYFRTIRDQTTYFLGEGREGLRGEHYLALLMLPFGDAQIRDYLVANVGRDEAWVDGFLTTIAGVHNLSELATRPLTLRLITDQVEFIERAKLEGRELRSVDLYGEFVDRWLSRDSGKHTLQPEHKQLLMEEIAAAMWRAGASTWSPDQVDDWLLALLDERPDLKRHYRERLPDLWKADFRTATFLSRTDDEFAFGHRSLAEYFLARYLGRALVQADPDTGGVAATWAMPVPSPESLIFLGEWIAGLAERERTVALTILAATTRAYVSQTSELAVSYALAASSKGHPHQSLRGIQLPGATLSGWNFGRPATRGDGAALLDMTEANLAGADLRKAIFTRVDLSSVDLRLTDLGNTEFHDSLLGAARLAGSKATGTILRRCRIDDADLAGASGYRGELLHCEPPTKVPGWRIAPLPDNDREGASALASRLEVLTGHTGGVSSVAWSPDGTRLATGGYDDTVRIWDAATGAQTQQLPGHTGGVRSVAWSPDGSRLATGGYDDTARIWDAATGAQTQQLPGHTGWVLSVAWSPDGSRLATGGYDDTARIWDAATGAQTQQLTGHTGWVLSVAWSPDGSRLATGGDDAAVRIWDAATGAQTQQLTGHTGWVLSVAWSPDGSRLATGGGDAAVRIWDAATGAQTQQLPGLTGVARSVAWSPDGSRLATGGDATARIWDAATGAQTQQLTGHTGGVRSVAWSPDGSRLATGGYDDTVRIWDAATGAQTQQLPGHTGWVLSVAWSPDGSRLATGGGDDDTVRIWDAATGAQTQQLTGHTGGVRSVAWSPDGSRLATGGDATVRIWDAATGAQTQQLTGHTGWVLSVAWSPDGSRLATGGDDAAVRIWDAATGAQTQRLPGHTGWVLSVAWSPDGRRLATGGDDATVRIWDAATGAQTQQLTGHTGGVRSVAWSPDGSRLATGGDDAAVRIWDAATGAQTQQLTGHTGGVPSVAWSPDGSRLATGGYDDTVRIWDAATGAQTQQLPGHTGWVSSLAWSPDGTRLATGGDATARIWDAATGAQVGPAIFYLPGGEAAVFDAVSHELIGASEGAWRWLGWNVIQDGRMTRLPAETFGPLPPLMQPTAAD